MREIDHEIELVNNILEQAVRHGADIGGSYESNEGNLVCAIIEWLAYRNLFDKYEVIHTDDGSNWCKIRIVEKHTCGECRYFCIDEKKSRELLWESNRECGAGVICLQLF